MKIISWNVNGIRAVVKKGFADFIEQHDPDILCLQETKINEQPSLLCLNPYKYQYWSHAEKKGYSGTAILSKKEPLSVQYGIGMPGPDDEGRVVSCEFEDFFVVCVYTPNSKRQLERLDERQEWDAAFLAFVKNLEDMKPVIFAGDLNVAHKPIDLARPDANKTTAKKPGNAGFTDQEREGFTNILEGGFIDTFRKFYPDKTDQYTWWTYMHNARANNVGWRIDYVMVSPDVEMRLKDAFILSEIMGSDHCPVGIMLND